jgi:hypothetical protein
MQLPFHINSPEVKQLCEQQPTIDALTAIAILTGQHLGIAPDEQPAFMKFFHENMNNRFEHDDAIEHALMSIINNPISFPLGEPVFTRQQSTPPQMSIRVSQKLLFQMIRSNCAAFKFNDSASIVIHCTDDVISWDNIAPTDPIPFTSMSHIK